MSTTKFFTNFTALIIKSILLVGKLVGRVISMIAFLIFCLIVLILVYFIFSNLNIRNFHKIHFLYTTNILLYNLIFKTLKYYNNRKIYNRYIKNIFYIENEIIKYLKLGFKNPNSLLFQSFFYL